MSQTLKLASCMFLECKEVRLLSMCIFSVERCFESTAVVRLGPVEVDCQGRRPIYARMSLAKQHVLKFAQYANHNHRCCVELWGHSTCREPVRIEENDAAVEIRQLIPNSDKCCKAFTGIMEITLQEALRLPTGQLGVPWYQQLVQTENVCVGI
jgi:hypothetical protein